MHLIIKILTLHDLYTNRKNSGCRIDSRVVPNVNSNGLETLSKLEGVLIKVKSVIIDFHLFSGATSNEGKN